MSGWSRQQPGSACEECRKRKLRCDRQRPQCGTCSDADIPCEFNTKRLQRGPKQGGLKALRSRIGKLIDLTPDEQYEVTANVQRPGATLEGLLRKYQERSPSAVYDNDLSENTPSDGSDSDVEQTQSVATKNPTNKTQPSFALQSRRSSTDLLSFIVPAIPTGINISGLMRGDLDQLYFERVHPIVPILQKHRYFSWANHSTTDVHRKCLQFAMWTLAMSLSTQFESVREHMYSETRQMLEELDMCESDMALVRIEQAQAWILITFYEFLRTNYRRGYISAGRVFRLVQLLRLHEVDNPTVNMGNSEKTSGEDWVATEEKRRAFWVAYCLDRFICVGSKGLVTLSEEVICTCLPALESDFHRGHASQIWFLSEAISSNVQFSPLAECAIMATIFGRVLSHKHVSTVEQVYGNAALDFWARHEWLNSILVTRRDSLSFNHPNVSVFADPMLVFAFMAVHATTIYLCEVAVPLGEMEQYRAAVAEYQGKALWAAREIARLSREQDQVGHFKAHVFMPVAVFLSAEHLITHRNSTASDTDSERGLLETELEGCVETLRKMQRVNNLAKHYLQILEAEHFQVSIMSIAVG